jgi:hypothetical protein
MLKNPKNKRLKNREDRQENPKKQYFGDERKTTPWRGGAAGIRPKLKIENIDIYKL